jgi:hypothetical protein
MLDDPKLGSRSNVEARPRDPTGAAHWQQRDMIRTTRMTITIMRTTSNKCKRLKIVAPNGLYASCSILECP